MIAYTDASRVHHENRMIVGYCVLGREDLRGARVLHTTNTVLAEYAAILLALDSVPELRKIYCDNITCVLGINGHIPSELTSPACQAIRRVEGVEVIHCDGKKNRTHYFVRKMRGKKDVESFDIDLFSKAHVIKRAIGESPMV